MTARRRDDRRTERQSDAALIASTRLGDERAYAELYARHASAARATAWSLLRSQPEVEDVTSEAFARVFAMLRAGRGPDEAFRPYLLSCVRRGCIDQATRNQRLLPLERAVDADHSVRGEDELDRRTESELMACAFTSLPQRWRQVLWLTEVEHRRHDDVGARLGLAPAAVAALAARARQGLSAAYLRAHLGDRADRECRAVAERLPAFVRGSASVSDRRRVAAHLAQCTSCRAAEHELHDLNASLRSLPVATLVGVGAAATAVGRGWLARLLARLGRGGGTASGVPGATAGAGAGAVGGIAVGGAGGLGALATASAVAAMVLVPSLALASDAQSGSAFTNPAVVRHHAPTSAATGSTARPTTAAGGEPGDPTAGNRTPSYGTAGAPSHGGAVGDGTTGPSASTASPAPAISGASSQLATPTISLPGIALPGIALPSLGASPVALPSLSTPAISLPPLLPPIDPPGPLPVITVPPVTVPPVTVPPVTLPPVTVPPVTLPVVTVPPVTLPPVTVPVVTVPSVTLPPIDLPLG